MREPKAAVLVVDDEEKLCRYLLKEFERKGYAAFAAHDREGARDILARERVDVVLLDLVLPGTGGLEILAELRRDRPALQVIMLTGNAAVETAVRSMKLGAYDYLSKPYDMGELELLIDRAHADARMRRENQALRCELSRRIGPRELLGESAALTEVRGLLARLARGSAPVLIEGEAGTGKELAARLIHADDSWSEGLFMPLDCAALEEPILERELCGLLGLAGRGTVFLDDVGALPPALQERLTRFLDSGDYLPAGGGPALRSGARIVAATQEDLARAVREGRFDQTLLDRLGTARVRIPPLRERPEDIALLAGHFFARHRARQARGPVGLGPEVLARLTRYPWPGNARQLESVIARAVLLAAGEAVGPDDVYLPSAGEGPAEPADSLAAVERSHIVKVLAEAGGNRTRAAAVLGVDVKTLYNKLKGYQARLT